MVDGDNEKSVIDNNQSRVLSKKQHCILFLLYATVCLGVGVGLLYNKKTSFPVTTITGKYQSPMIIDKPGISPITSNVPPSTRNYFTVKEDVDDQTIHVMDEKTDFSLFYDGKTDNYQFYLQDIENFRLKESKFKPESLLSKKYSKVEAGLIFDTTRGYLRPIYWSLNNDGTLVIDYTSTSGIRQGYVPTTKY